MMAWIALIGAGILEILWAIGLKQFSWAKPLFLVWLLAPLVGSMALLTMAARTIPIGTAYAVWTGIGAAGVALLGMWLYSEPVSWPRLACIGLILVGVIGLRVFS